MLKGTTQNLSFEDLMAQAAAVAKTQDAALAEKSRLKRQEMEEKKRKEERTEKARKQKQEHYDQWREEQNRNFVQSSEMRPRSRPVEQKKMEVKSKPRAKAPGLVASVSNSRGSKKGKTAAVAVPTPAFASKKKPVHISFEELMRKAKEVPAAKSSSAAPSARGDVQEKLVAHGEVRSRQKMSENGKPNTQQRSSTNTRDNSSIFLRKNNPIPKPTEVNSSGAHLSARERVRLLYQEPVKKVDRQKRDRRSISEIQREIRHSKGIYSDEEDESKKKDRRLYDARANPRPSGERRQPSVIPSNSRVAVKRREPLGRESDAQLRTSPSKPWRPEYRDARARPAPPPKITDPEGREPRMRPTSSVPRMPFSRGMDMRRPKRRPIETEEEDEELASFIVDDEEEAYEDDYSVEIGRIFRYDKKKYANDRYSDDDMEVDASEVLKEEKRSERIGRREDLMEERMELERLKKRKTKAK
ncbi:hypothetical protein DFQ28_002146 [Apophysomyces sp. BC1034]|nr:hypothetical protein DFQ30_007615 [Apophysomyces sp. BC1015]KAG0179807.1 hypothetical protein DFQ29_001654 [Apophysomyces sp. BC1021]KAG0190367.1 hypothetical protein DFQ28_002146 [Apophysomyces sp. BC1034]